ncbi:hypothetical protein NO2_0946 [Candidatus Termititenax persephonae]|uniref:SMP-30/Gluconolactonase/LRE-like region domain-containing protein n=1 Tax=Candidatus Termititenax persephonae TaxID=2218525 RepID=A0A388TIZ6_9BACT|nr:hypothetical protein NO2_0946 [Candidatus Termititenax persephonae]
MLLGAESEPYKISAAPDGSLLLADPFQNQIRIRHQDNTEDLLQHNFNQPQAAVMARDGALYVLDTGGQRLWKFTRQNGFQPAGVLTGFRYPRDLALSPDQKWLYVLDSGTQKIVRVQLDGFQKSSSFGDLHNPYGLDVDIYGNIFVADTGAGRIVKYSPAGKLLLSFGRTGSSPGELLLPQDVAVGLSKKIYVADTGQQAVKIFTETGEYGGQLREVAGQAVRSLAWADGVLWLSAAGQALPQSLDLAYQVKNITPENLYFSPNNDGVKDAAVFRIETDTPAVSVLEIFSDGELQETVESDQNLLVWNPQKVRAGMYSYFLLVKARDGQKEAVLQVGELCIDLRPPVGEDWRVSPAALVDTVPLLFSAESKEDAALNYRIFDQDQKLVYAAQGTQYSLHPTNSWAGFNQADELRNGKYRAEVTLTDRAGNTSSAKNLTIYVNIEHPILDFAATSPPDADDSALTGLQLRLLRPAQVIISCQKDEDSMVQIFKQTLPAGEQFVPLALGELAGTQYLLHISAAGGGYQDALSLVCGKPRLEDLRHSPELLAWEAPDYRALAVSYKLSGADGQLYLTARLWHQGRLYKTLFLREPRRRGLQTDHLAAAASMPEGEYTYEYLVEDSYGNAERYSGDFVFIKRRPQLAALTLTPAAISPANQDGVQDSAVFDFSAQISEYLPQTTVGVFLQVGSVYAREWTAQAGSVQAAWDGRDAQGNYVKDGEYLYELKIKDAMGVFSPPVTGSLVVANSAAKIGAVSVRTDNLPSGTIAALAVELKDFPLRQQIVLSLYDSAGTLIERSPTIDIAAPQDYAFALREELADGYHLSGGQYYYKLQIVDTAGNDFEYVFAPTLNYTDRVEIITSGQKLSRTGLGQRNNKREVAYVKGDPVPLSVRAHDQRAYYTDAYFYLDVRQYVELTLNDSTSAKQGGGRIEGVTGWVKGWYGLLGPGQYRLRATCAEASRHSTDAFVAFVGHDVWHRPLDKSTAETQADSGDLDKYDAMAGERAFWLSLTAQTIQTDDYEHTVFAENGRIYYQRRGRGQDNGTRPLLLSSPEAWSADPSLAADENNAVRVAWVERQGGVYSVQTLFIPEKYLPLRGDPAVSAFSLRTAAAEAGGVAASLDDLALEISRQINYPNPFADGTTIRYHLSRDADVTLRIYNAAGQPVRRLDFFAGAEGGRGATLGDPYNDVVWSGDNDYGQSVLNGAYVYEITADAGNRTVKVRGKMLKWR